MLEPTLTYLGDLTEELEHRVMGPDTLGGFVRVVETSYDVEADLTYARYEPMDIETMRTEGRLNANGELIHIPAEVEE